MNILYPPLNLNLNLIVTWQALCNSIALYILIYDDEGRGIGEIGVGVWSWIMNDEKETSM